MIQCGSRSSWSDSYHISGSLLLHSSSSWHSWNGVKGFLVKNKFIARSTVTCVFSALCAQPFTNQKLRLTVPAPSPYLWLCRVHLQPSDSILQPNLTLFRWCHLLFQNLSMLKGLKMRNIPTMSILLWPRRFPVYQMRHLSDLYNNASSSWFSDF